MSIRISEEVDGYTLVERLWSGAENVMQRILDEGKEDTFFAILSDMHVDSDHIDITEINDLLRFEAETVYDWLGMKGEEEEEDSKELVFNSGDIETLIEDFGSTDLTDYLTDKLEDRKPIALVYTTVIDIQVDLERTLTDREVTALIDLGS